MASLALHAGFPKALLDCTRLTSVQLIARDAKPSRSTEDLILFGSLPSELSRMTTPKQLRIFDCNVREFVGIHQLTSLEYLQVGTERIVNNRRTFAAIVSAVPASRITVGEFCSRTLPDIESVLYLI